VVLVILFSSSWTTDSIPLYSEWKFVWTINKYTDTVGDPSSDRWPAQFRISSEDNTGQTMNNSTLEKIPRQARESNLYLLISRQGSTTEPSCWTEVLFFQLQYRNLMKTITTPATAGHRTSRKYLFIYDVKGLSIRVLHG